MSEWIEKPLGEVTSYLAKGIPPKYTEEFTENAIYVLNQKCNRDFVISYDAARLHDLTQKKVAEEKMVHPGDVLINSTGEGTAGRVAQIWDLPYPTTTDGHMILMRPTIEIDPLYYGYAVKEYQSQIETLAEGSTGQTEINKKRLQDEIIIRFPKDKDEQHCIAEVLENIDKKIEVNNKINRNLTNQFIAIVDDFIYHLDSFELKRLDDVADCQNGRAFYKEGYDEEGAFVIDLGNVNTSANFIYTNADKHVSLERYEQDKLVQYRVHKDDLVMVMTDRKSTMDLLGKTGKIYKEGYYLLNQRMYRIRAKEGMNVNYLYAILNSTRVCNRLKEKALGSVQKYVNTKEINEIEIIVPTPKKMQELSKIVNPISKQMETNILENEKLNTLRDELLPKLMSGELDLSYLDI